MVEPIPIRQPMPGTGRRVLIEDGKRVMDKDLQHLMLRSRREAKAVTRRFWQTTYPPLDQGMTSECVIYTFDKYLTSWPTKNKGFASAGERTKIYTEVQKIDEWPGEGYDGTSVRAMMRWALKNGYIKDYHWGFEVEPVLDHVLADSGGPVCMGTLWDDQMMYPDRYGYIHSTISEADDMGHAWLVIGADREKVHPKTGDVGAFRCLTSWNGWGTDRNSRFWLTFKEMDKLIKLAGEAAIANEIMRVI